MVTIMTNKTEYLQALKDNDVEFTDNVRDAIYILTVKGKSYFVDAGFYHGIRSIDHYELKLDGYSWEDIIQMGTVVVPETICFIGEKHKRLAKYLGYKILPEDNNHIVGWKN